MANGDPEKDLPPVDDEKEEIAEMPSSPVMSDHALTSVRPGESEVEQMANRVENRRANRVKATYACRRMFLEGCQEIAQSKKDSGGAQRISPGDLQAYREKVAAQCEQLNTPFVQTTSHLGWKQPVLNLLEVIDKAIEVCKINKSEWLYYQDFTFYYTVSVSKFPFLRSEIRVACSIIFLYYFFTPILFCHIVDEKSICVEGEDWYDGWMSSLYFASTTLSTVGYGDLSVQQSPRWRSFIGSMYMVLSMVVAVAAFSAAAGSAFSALDDLDEKIVELFFKSETANAKLRTKVARAKTVKLLGIVGQFLFLNLFGTLVSRAFVSSEFRTADSERAEPWTWMTSLYWAIQTTTTIGYGDLAQPFHLRWFQIFYLTLSTYFVGSALGKLGDLRSELEDYKRYYVWENRKVTRRFIEEMQAYEHDGKVDQFEFLVGSLLVLNKISSDDIKPIMNRYRKLAGDRGFITIGEDTEEDKISDGVQMSDDVAGY